MQVTLRQIKYFVATAELGQISLAALQLNISQSAVTTAIKELEEIIGAQLFVRSTRGMDLTEEGRSFLNGAYNVLSSVAEAVQMPNLHGSVSGTLTIATTYTVSGYFIPVHLKRLEQLYPKLRINLHELSRHEIEEGLISGRYDMSILLTSNTDNPELHSETFFNSERRLWVASDHPLLKKQSVSLKDVSTEPYIMFTLDEAADTAMRYWRASGYLPDIRFRTTALEAVRSMVANGAGVTILSDMVYRPWSLEGKRIETIVLKDKVPAMSIGIACKNNIELTPAMLAFRDYFRKFYMRPQISASSLV